MTDLLSRLKAAKVNGHNDLLAEEAIKELPDVKTREEPKSDKSNINVLTFAINHGWDNQLIKGLSRCSWLPINEQGEIENTMVFIHHKLGKAAGRAEWAPNRRILLHPVYADEFEQNEFQGELKETFFHEVAHFCAFYGNDYKHGPLWKSAMEAFGYQPRRCYDGALFDYKNYKNRREERFAQLLRNYIKRAEKANGSA